MQPVFLFRHLPVHCQKEKYASFTHPEKRNSHRLVLLRDEFHQIHESCCYTSRSKEAHNEQKQCHSIYICGEKNTTNHNSLYRHAHSIHQSPPVNISQPRQPQNRNSPTKHICSAEKPNFSWWLAFKVHNLHPVVE